MIIEDDFFIGLHLLSLVQKTFPDANLVHSLQSALPDLATAKVLLTDWSFPLKPGDPEVAGAGLDAIKSAKQQNPNIGIVVVSGNATEATLIQAVRQADPQATILAKPFSDDAVLKAVQDKLSIVSIKQAHPQAPGSPQQPVPPHKPTGPI